ncbi:MAG: hypothetical protein ACRBHB_16595 [Arenicella sp.]
MKRIYLIVLALLSFACSASNDSDESLYGAYRYISGETLYEEFELSSDHVFSSWLHQRPGTSGTWSLKNQVLYIKEDGLDNEIQAKVIKLDGKEAVFRFDDTKTSATFERVE